MMPPKGCVWLSRTSHAWQVQVKPLGSRSFSWGRYGYTWAAILAARQAWKGFLAITPGKYPDDVAVPRLMEMTKADAGRIDAASS